MNTCSACQRELPRSAFDRAEFKNRGSGKNSDPRCRDCKRYVRCWACGQYSSLGPIKGVYKGTRCCQNCRDNALVSRLLQRPTEQMTHFGVGGVRALQAEVEHVLLLVCFKYGLCERLLLQTIIGFLRVPFVMSIRGLQYCELCNASWDDSSSALTTHLLSPHHCALEASINDGAKSLVSHVALTLAKELGEQPAASLSRFRSPSGLGISERFCSPADVERARVLRRVRGLDIPAKCLRDSIGIEGHMEWLTPGQLVLAEDYFAEYQKRGKKNVRRRTPELPENHRQMCHLEQVKLSHKPPETVDRTSAPTLPANLLIEDEDDEDYDWPDY